MIRSYSFISILVIVAAAIIIRCGYFSNNKINGYNALTWDALGYYMYLPAAFIYDDVKNLEWLPKIDSAYHVTGGHLYQANRIRSGNYVFKYLGGVAILEIPFFVIGHAVAYFTGEPQDGFSWPYQYAIIWGVIAWFIIGLLVLRIFLLKFFNEVITSVTLLLICLATNLLQYISVDGAMSHGFIFTLYCFILWFTNEWHARPKKKSAFLIGLLCGLATISRPTELISIFIPLLWGLQNKVSSKEKWKLVREHKAHIYWAVVGGIIGVLPQLLYWKYVSGSFLFDVGSKWNFLNPWFRVLFGFETGLFIYTPVFLFIMSGFWFMKEKEFGKSVITFCLLNIYIIISWSDWKYGATYSTRALVQSYPVFSLSLGSFLEIHFTGKRKYFILIAGALFVLVNFYQLKVYNTGVLQDFSVLESFFK